jgi:lysophospholipase L1-like esterase
MRFVALGHSLTVGLGDPGSDGGWRGWARLLGESFDDVELHNMAYCGARVADVAVHQLPKVLDLNPAVVSVIVGMNDTLRGDFRIEQIADDLIRVHETLATMGTHVLTARLPEPGRVLGMPELVCRPLERRVRAINAVTDDIAAHYATVHLDMAGHPEVYESEMWGIDRLHPSERGHRLLARLFAEALLLRGVAVYTLPGLETDNPPLTRRAQVTWLMTDATRWLARRSRDLLPTMVGLVAREWWYEKRGLVAELDQQLLAELDRISYPVPDR